jgi:hypothetical protein
VQGKLLCRVSMPKLKASGYWSVFDLQNFGIGKSQNCTHVPCLPTTNRGVPSGPPMPPPPLPNELMRKPE